MRLKPVLLASRGRRWVLINKTGINFMIFILIFVKNCLQYYAIQDFSELLRTDSNPADINRFRSHTGNTLYYLLLHHYDQKEPISKKYILNTKEQCIRFYQEQHP